MTMPDEPGNCPIIATPFTEDGEVDYESLEHEMRVIADQGCEAATLFGIASEFHKLSDEERRRTAELVTDVGNEVGVSPVLSVTHESTVVAVEWAREYEEMGADCIMVFPPRFGDVPADGVVDHVRRIGEAVSIPVMVQHTDLNVDVSPAEWAALHEEVPNVEYFKIEANPPGPYISELVEETDGSVTTLVGNWGYKMIDAYDRGAVGVMPIVLYNELYVEIHDRYLNGDREGAVELHDQLLAALNDLDTLAAAKYVVAEQGIIETSHCREPVGGMEDEVIRGLVDEAHAEMMELVESL
jgi:4-hydroxy-tetrahydrodipicolinate synthase